MLVFSFDQGLNVWASLSFGVVSSLSHKVLNISVQCESASGSCFELPSVGICGDSRRRWNQWKLVEIVCLDAVSRIILVTGMQEEVKRWWRLFREQGAVQERGRTRHDFVVDVGWRHRLVLTGVTLWRRGEARVGLGRRERAFGTCPAVSASAAIEGEESAGCGAWRLVVTTGGPRLLCPCHASNLGQEKGWSVVHLGNPERIVEVVKVLGRRDQLVQAGQVGRYKLILRKKENSSFFVVLFVLGTLHAILYFKKLLIVLNYIFSLFRFSTR